MIRRMSCIICFILFISNNFYSQTGWEWQNPQPQGNQLNDASFLNSRFGLLSGNYGTVLKTTNGGNNWIILSTGVTLNLYSICIVDAQIYYACGEAGIVIKTTNGGNSWTSVTLTGQLNKISFRNGTTGCIVGNSGKIYKTTNGGINWIQRFSSATADLLSVQFINDTLVYATGGNGYLKSINAGDSWVVSLTGSTYNSFDMDFGDINTGYICGNNTAQFNRYAVLLKTQNAGQNWGEVLTNSSINYYSRVKMYDDTFGIIMGRTLLEESKLYITTNGSSWNEVTLPSSRLQSFSKISKDTLYFSGLGGEIFHTTNNGVNWSSQFIGHNYNFNSLYFINLQTGFAAGNDPGAVILKTTDAGLNWFLNYNAGSAINYITFADQLTGYAAGRNGMILKTTNSGENWNTLNSGVTGNITDIKFTSANTGFAVGASGLAIRTTNGGINWSQMSLSSTYLLLKISFADQNTGYIMSNFFRMYKTTDGGLNWVNISTGINDSHDLKFVNQNTGYQCGPARILKTTNAGQSWSSYSFQSGYNLNSLYFINDQTGYSVGTYGAILRTTNSGNNWNFLNQITNTPMKSIFFINDSIGYAAGDNGAILKTTNSGGGIVSINNVKSETPSIFNLHQNYPNPFNPTTQIKFDISKASFTTIVIYDASGKETEKLIERDLTPGTYSVDWNASEYPSGVYFYKIAAGDFVQTKKMVLVK